MNGPNLPNVTLSPVSGLGGDPGPEVDGFLGAGKHLQSILQHLDCIRVGPGRMGESEERVPLGSGFFWLRLMVMRLFFKCRKRLAAVRILL